MRVCGKALPPRGAFLLMSEFLVLVILTPVLFTLPALAGAEAPRPLASTALALLRMMAAGAACQAIFYYCELYNLQVSRTPADLLIRVLRALALLFLVLALACAALPFLSPAIPHVLAFVLVLAVTAIAVRLTLLTRKPQRVMLVSAGEDASEVLESIAQSPEWNFEVVQIVAPADVDRAVRPGETPGSFCDRVIVSGTQNQPADLLLRIVNWKMTGFAVEDADNFIERSRGRVRVDGLTLAQCILSSRFSNGLWKRDLKRSADLLAGVVLLVLAAPLMLLVGLAIASRRDGPIIFRQRRLGLYQKEFTIYKFRTMRAETRSSGATWAAHESHRITRLGAFLRRYRLDELPQLVNVLKGDMSLVGPRPEQPDFCKMLAEQIPFYMQRFSVPPGLTGWAQVRYGYGSSVEESKRKLEFDLFYIKHLSLWLDLAILLETIKVVLTGRGAL